MFNLRDFEFTGGILLYAHASTIGFDPRHSAVSTRSEISIRSHHTGRVERFRYLREEVNQNELLWWDFVPVDPTCRVRGVRIYND